MANFTKHLLFHLVILAAVLLVHLTTAQLMICPQVCSCIWRNGKQTTICENQNLISIPNQISPSTQVLDLNTNNFQILPSRAFQERGLINLQKLFLPRCKLGAIADDAFVQLTNLVELDLSENLLTTVPVKALANTTNLRRLLLNGNHIATISAEAFAPLTGLKFLNLSGCQTHTIEPRAFWGLHDLEYLYLHSNQLSTLPYAVVQDLPALYSFDLYRNPWVCNCEMRATREWMVRNNVGQSIPPACELPLRLSGLMWNSLDLEDFACQPDIISSPSAAEVARPAGANATLHCTVKGLPEPKIYWYLDDGSGHSQRNLTAAVLFPSSGSSLLPTGNSLSQKYHLTEERSSSSSSGEAGTVSSILTIVNLDPEDDAHLIYVCWAENRAGSRAKNFTVTVLPSSLGLLGSSSGWSRVELAGGIVGILISLVLAFVLVTLLLIRSKKFGNALSSAKKLSSDGNDMEKSKVVSHFLKGGHALNSLVRSYPNNTSGGQNYGYQTSASSAASIPHHLSMLGLDGIDQKPEIFGHPNSGGNYGGGARSPVPDLVSAAANNQLGLLGTSGYELNTYSNNGMPSYQPSSYHTQNHAHQSSDTSMMMLMTNNPGANSESYDLSMYQGDPNLQMYSQQNPEADGLYRAVMVQAPHPPQQQGSLIIGNQHFQNGSPQLQPHHLTTLSAGNLLYNQYALSQHDLRLAAELQNQQQQLQNQNQHLQNHYPSKSPFPEHPNNQAYILANHNSELYDDDDVFAPPHSNGSGSTANYSPNGVYEQHHQNPQNHLMSSAIYGQTTNTSSRRSSPWSNATVIPNHHLHQLQQQHNLHQLMVTPTPNLMNIRYSPDEGYGEEGGSSTTVTTGGSGVLNVPSVGQLEGTEV